MFEVVARLLYFVLVIHITIGNAISPYKIVDVRAVLDIHSQALNTVSNFAQYRLAIYTAYPWSSQKFGNDVINTDTAQLAGFPQTPDGQRNYVAALEKLLRSQPANRGVGFWWWEGLARPVQSWGAATLWNGGMANSTLVDLNGVALPSLQLFNG